jgi:Ca-activated chloride channel family protein
MSEFSFQYPLVFLIIIIFVVCEKYCKEKSNAIYFPHVEKLFIKSAKKSSLLRILKWLGIIATITALASPVLTTEYQNIKKDGRDIVMILDASESMLKGGFDKKDYRKNKFFITKDIVSKFIEKRKNDRLALVTFADVAFVASPLTFERRFLKGILEMQRVGIAGRKTAINDSIVQSYGLLEKSKAKSKIAILLTDGVDNMSKVSFEDIKSLIGLSDIKLYTIGIGSSRDFNAKYLKELANAGKGEFFSAKDSDKLEEIYSKIDKLEVTKLDNKKILSHEYLYIYPLFIAILSLLFFLYIRNRRGF